MMILCENIKTSAHQRILVHKTDDDWVEEQFPAFTDDEPDKGEAAPLSTRTNKQEKNLKEKTNMIKRQ